MMLAFGLFTMVVYHSPGNRFMRKYGSLELGMSESDVNNLFGKSPEYTCNFKSHRICYYVRPMIPGVSPEIDPQDYPPDKQVANHAKIPYIYAAAQMAFDPDGRLSAYTLNGETMEIVSTKGRVKGSHFKKLDESVFESP